MIFLGLLTDSTVKFNNTCLLYATQLKEASRKALTFLVVLDSREMVYRKAYNHPVSRDSNGTRTSLHISLPKKNLLIFAYCILRKTSHLTSEVDLTG